MLMLMDAVKLPMQTTYWKPSGSVYFNCYQLLSSTTSLPQRDMALFEDEFGEVSFSLALTPPTVTGQPPVTQEDDDKEEFELNVAVVAGVTAAAAVAGVALSVAVAIGLYCW